MPYLGNTYVKFVYFVHSTNLKDYGMNDIVTYYKNIRIKYHKIVNFYCFKKSKKIKNNNIK